jgi:hypothetical protein
MKNAFIKLKDEVVNIFSISRECPMADFVKYFVQICSSQAVLASYAYGYL